MKKLKIMWIFSLILAVITMLAAPGLAAIQPELSIGQNVNSAYNPAVLAASNINTRGMPLEYPSASYARASSLTPSILPAILKNAPRGIFNTRKGDSLANDLSGENLKYFKESVFQNKTRAQKISEILKSEILKNETFEKTIFEKLQQTLKTFSTKLFLQNFFRKKFPGNFKKAF